MTQINSWDKINKNIKTHHICRWSNTRMNLREALYLPPSHYIIVTREKLLMIVRHNNIKNYALQRLCFDCILPDVKKCKKKNLKNLKNKNDQNDQMTKWPKWPKITKMIKMLNLLNMLNMHLNSNGEEKRKWNFFKNFISRDYRV